MSGAVAQQREMICKKGVLRSFAKFTRKTPVPQSLLIKALAQVFSCEFFKIPKNTFSTEHIWMTASGYKVSTHIFE